MREPQRTGWADNGEDPKTYGPMTQDMIPPGGGMWVTDMPVGRPRPQPPRPRIKGVAPATIEDDPDYAPGSGAWRPV